MTVPVEIPSFTFVTDGVTTSFAIPFTWTESSDIQAAVTVGGAVISAPFSVTGTSGNSQIVFNTAPAIGTGVGWRVTPIEQDQATPFASGGAFPNGALAAGLDYLTRIAAELSLQTGGSAAAQAALSAAAALAAQLVAQAADANAQVQAINALNSANLAAAAETAAYTYELGAQSAQSATALLGAVQGVLGAAATALPYCVTAISGGVGTGTGGTNGTYALGVTGGPPGFAATVTIAGGAIANYTITNAGLATTNSAPTLSLSAVPGLTGATTPTATVGTIPMARTFWAPSTDGTQLLAWGNNAGALKSVPFDDPGQFSIYQKSGIDAANFSLAPATIGDIAGAANPPSGTFYAWGTGMPVLTGGALSQVQFMMSGAATISLLFFDMASLQVLKVFTGIAAVAGINTLTSANGLGEWYCPVGAIPVIIVTAGAGQHLQGTGGANACARFATSAVSALVAGNTMPTPTSIAAADPALSITTTPTLSQSEDARIAVIENNHIPQVDSFVASEPALTPRSCGITSFNSAATSAAPSGWIFCTPPMLFGGKALSAFVNMNTAGSGVLAFFRAVDRVPNYQLWQLVPTGFLAAGANTIALPEIDLPPGCIMGYVPIIGGVLNSIGNAGRLTPAIPVAGFTGIRGNATTYAATQSYGGEIGLNVTGPSTRLATTGSLGQLRNADNGRIKPQLPKFFMLGVWDQPAVNAGTWAARGVNTYFGGYADAADGNAAGWLAACANNALYYVRRPGLSSLEQAQPAGQAASAAQLTQVASDVNTDIVNTYSLGYNTPDEPDGTIVYEQGTGSPTVQTTLYVSREINRWKQVDRCSPVFMNMQGLHIQYPSAYIATFMSMPDVDILGFDSYPNNVNGVANCIWWQTWTVSASNNETFSTVNGAALEWLSQTNNPAYANLGPLNSGGKPTFCFLAVSKIIDTCVAPTPGEFRTLAWSAVIGGVMGFVYFPQDVTPGTYTADASDPNVLTEMSYLHHNLAVMQNAGCLIDANNGGRIPSIKRMSAPLTNSLGQLYPGTYPKDNTGTRGVFQSPIDNQMQGGFEAIAVYGTNGALYYLIQNLLGQSATLNDALWGIAAMTFSAYETRFIAASALAVNLFSESGQ